MSDASVRAALRSDERLVVIEAPAGCGKTHQGADYASEIARAVDGRLLILTHTHAACSVFAERTRGVGARVEIRTIDGLISQIAGAYHAGLDLPADPAAWARRIKDGYSQLAMRVASFLDRHAMVAAALARRYPFVVCDEHQDCSGDQHAIGMALHREGARLRLFADPMQHIYKDKVLPGGRPPADWQSLASGADAYEELDTPHRWRDGCPDLGSWTLEARRVLKAGGKLDLRAKLPRSVEVVFAENQARRYGDYQLATADRRRIDAFERANSSLLIVSHFSDTAQNLRAFFGRRLPLWEGHTRPGLKAWSKRRLRIRASR
ncbi:UvrD-helicase domain-containing protein [Pararhizobium gei]|uniref:UvrD-helicase domain-containing protein n=1 Tax=Pararhizobium gei TaxID=1395951 RepID=UPI0023DC1D4D|nr:UvrD-helicase domain-containing protein [Rhizobium gei]